ASRPIFSSMNRRAHRVMWVYASGNRLADPALRAKKARGRPRPPGRDDRSTRPFVSRTVRCFKVAILEMWTDAARSVRETAPSFLSVRRICFFVDENPTSSPPEETSARSAIVCPPERRDIIYLCVYKIDPTVPSPHEDTVDESPFERPIRSRAGEAVEASTRFCPSGVSRTG